MERKWAKCRKSLYVLLFAFFLYSCSSAPEKTKTAPQKPSYEVYTVEIKGMKFAPDSIVVNKGDEVVFVNRDMVAHCVTEDSNAWTSSAMPAGESYLLVAKQSSNYYCAIHKVMKGKIIVR